MGHRAGPEFFDRKRDWSERKDRVLSDYLPPYVQKVAHALGYPVLVVDGFAGPGQFRDGKAGSPLIIRRILEEAMNRPGVRARALFVESDPGLYQELESRMRDVPWIQTRQGRFLDQVEEIERLIPTSSVFLYLDPYTVEGLEWAALDRLFRKIEEGQSVEVLLNFNAESFVRRGLAALKMDVPAADAADDPDTDVPTGADATTIGHLDEIVGGDWWRRLLSADSTYSEKIVAVLAGFSDKLRSRFSRVCAHNIYALATDKRPKYALVFGSRSQEALLLMNDAMVGSREMLAEGSEPEEALLFDNRSEEIVPDKARMTRLILEGAAVRKPRIDVIEGVVRAWIGGWRRAEIRGEIEALLRSGRLRSATGRPRINDDVEIWVP